MPGSTAKDIIINITVAYLPGCMHPGICPPCNGKPDTRLPRPVQMEHCIDSCFQFPLYSALAPLFRPPMEIGTVLCTIYPQPHTPYLSICARESREYSAAWLPGIYNKNPGY